MHLTCASRRTFSSSLFFFNDTATTEIYTLSLHDALPISGSPSCLYPRTTRWGTRCAWGRRIFRRCSEGCSRCRSEEHTSELQSRLHLVCRLLLEKKNTDQTDETHDSADEQYSAEHA